MNWLYSYVSLITQKRSPWILGSIGHRSFYICSPNSFQMMPPVWISQLYSYTSHIISIIHHPGKTLLIFGPKSQLQFVFINCIKTSHICQTSLGEDLHDFGSKGQRSQVRIFYRMVYGEPFSQSDRIN